MAQKGAFIWDLDGTLLDSYEAILAGLEETYEHFDLVFDKSTVKTYILNHSVHELIQELAAQHNLDVDQLSRFRARSLREKNARIQLMPGAREVLDWTVDQGIPNFIYTHKGDNTFQLLDNLGLTHYFTEVLTADSGFARKPDPQALLYLMDKYQLKRNFTYYIGDRLLDVQTAQNAQIKSLNLLIDDEEGNQKIAQLQEIPTVTSHLRKD